MVKDRAPPINLTVSASLLDETSSFATTTASITGKTSIYTDILVTLFVKLSYFCQIKPY